MIFKVEEEQNGVRIDTFISQKEEKFSRSVVQNLLKEGKILLDGKLVKPSTKLSLGQEVEITKEAYHVVGPQDLIAQDIPIPILYEDEDIIIVNKPKNMVVHPGVGNTEGTLVNALLGKKELSNRNGDMRPGIVHRLDKNTTGVLVIAKNNYAHQKIAEQMQNRETKKIYLALVRGIIPENEGVIELPIGRHPTDRKKMAVNRNGKEAITKFKVLKRYQEGYTLLEIELKTGRTHQIRVHMSHIGYPIVGDDMYSNGKNPFGVTSQMLHAYRLSFIHPTKKELMEFEAPLPEEFERVLNQLRDS